MCLFITAVLPPDTAIAQLQEVARAHGASFAILENAFIQRQLQRGETYHRATDGHCDCGTQLATRTLSAKSAEASELEQQLAKFKKRGWSKTKIDRWLEQHQQATVTRAERRAHASDEQPDWLGFFAEIRERDIAPYVGLLVHWYDGSPTNDHFTIADREVVSGDSLSDERLAEMQRDRLYVVRMRAVERR